MYGTLISLEPISYEANMIVQDELKEVNAIVFINEAFFHIGYSINDRQYFKLKM